MVKNIRAIEFVENHAHIGNRQSGWREDYQYFSQEGRNLINEPAEA